MSDTAEPDPYAPPSSELVGRGDTSWRAYDHYVLRRDLDRLRSYSVLDADDEPLLNLLPRNFTSTVYPVFLAGDPPAPTGIRFDVRIGLLTKHVLVSDSDGFLGDWRHTLFGRWKLARARELSWVGSYLKRRLFGGVELFGPHGKGVAAIKVRTLRRGAVLEFVPETRFPRELALAVTLGQLIGGN